MYCPNGMNEKNWLDVKILVECKFDTNNKKVRLVFGITVSWEFLIDEYFEWDIQLFPDSTDDDGLVLSQLLTEGDEVVKPDDEDVVLDAAYTPKAPLK